MTGFATLPVGMFIPDPASARHLCNALGAVGLRVQPLPDPVRHPDIWLGTPLVAALIDPFCCADGVAAVVAALRGLVGGRPIMVVTPRDCAIQRVSALVSGADDAIFVDGHHAEVGARLVALLRRTNMAAAHAVLSCDDLEIDMIERRVARAGQAIHMPLREFDLLAHLARRRDQPVTRESLLRAVWNIGFDPGTNRIDVHVSRLRQRIDQGHSHAMLRTVKGIGYALVSRIGSQALAAHI